MGLALRVTLTSMSFGLSIQVHRLVAGGFGILICSLLSACSSQSTPPTKALHVVVLSIGFDFPETRIPPNLFRFAQRSTFYSDWSQFPTSPLTICASMLTGLRRDQHSAGWSSDELSPLADKVASLPEYLFSTWYNTAAIIAADEGMGLESGLNQGFLDYQVVPGDPVDVASMAVNWIDRHGDKPFFLFVYLPQADTTVADQALGSILKSMNAEGLLDSSLILLSVKNGFDLGANGVRRDVYLKAPGQREAAQDKRLVRPEHVPQMLLEHLSLPSTATPPKPFFTYPLEETQPRRDFSESMNGELLDQE